VKGVISRRLQMRRTPEVLFVLDRGIERGTSVLGLLNQLEQVRSIKGEPPEASSVFTEDDPLGDGPTPDSAEGAAPEA
jgi:ribosome-binding factor A